MTSQRSMKTASRVFWLALLAAGLLMVLAPSALALFTNGGFETGDFAGWTKATFLNPGLSGSAPFTGASIVRDPGGSDLTQIQGPFAEMSQTDPNTGDVLHYPLSGSYCAVINFLGASNNANSLLQQSTAVAGDVAPDGKIHVQFAWAAVVQNPAHADTEQPYVYVVLRNVTKGTLLYETFNFAGTSAVWQNAANSIQFTDWQVTDMAPDSTALAVGDTVELEAIASGCSLGGHWGYLYVDHFGAFIPVTPHITAANKIYDGTTTATLTSRTLTGAVPGDDVSLVGGTADFDSAAIGTGKTVTATGLSLAGTDADKYMLTSFTATTTANIIAKPTHPPTTKVKGLPSGWVRRFVRLTLVATPSADGPPVAYTEYRIGSGPWIRGNALIVKREGMTIVTYRSVDTAGNVETAKTCRVYIDLTRPAVHNDGEVNVLRGGVARFGYRLSDNLARVLRCRLVITYHGKIVVIKQLGLQPICRHLVTTLRCNMPATGARSYTWHIVAFDAAGNHASGIGQELEVWHQHRTHWS